jgi:hypothetical protein
MTRFPAFSHYVICAMFFVANFLSIETIPKYPYSLSKQVLSRLTQCPAHLVQYPVCDTKGFWSYCISTLNQNLQPSLQSLTRGKCQWLLKGLIP